VTATQVALYAAEPIAERPESLPIIWTHK